MLLLVTEHRTALGIRDRSWLWSGSLFQELFDHRVRRLFFACHWSDLHRLLLPVWSLLLLVLEYLIVDRLSILLLASCATLQVKSLRDCCKSLWV